VIFLLPTPRSHPAFIRFAVEHLKKEYTIDFLQKFYSDLIHWVSAIDLSQTTSLMIDSYSAKSKGRKPRDPTDMLRSLLLMHKLNVTSIDRWVYQLRTISVCAILSGFSKDDTPGVGTFYDFTYRLWLSDRPHKTGRNKRPLRKPKKAGKKNEKLDPKNPKITEKLVARALRTPKMHYAPKELDLLQQLFQNQFVLPSASKGLLGDTNALSIIGDGTPVETGGKSITSAARSMCFAPQTALMIYPSIYAFFVPVSTTRCLGYADTRSCITGIRNGTLERRFWIPPTTLSPSIPCSNTMMLPASST
jgi:hypothetical protein